MRLVTALCDWSWTGTCEIWFSPWPRQNKNHLRTKEKVNLSCWELGGQDIPAAPDHAEGEPASGKAALFCSFSTFESCRGKCWANPWGNRAKEVKGSNFPTALYICSSTCWHFCMFSVQRLLRFSMFPSVCCFYSTLGWNSCVVHHWQDDRVEFVVICRWA